MLMAFVYKCRVIRFVMLSVAVALTNACYTWRAEPLSPSNVSNEAQASTRRLTFLDGSRIVVYDARVVADTVRGWYYSEDAAGRGRRTPQRTEIALPLSELRVLEVYRFQTVKTLLTVGLPMAALVAFIIGMSNACFGLSC